MKRRVTDRPPVEGPVAGIGIRISERPDLLILALQANLDAYTVPAFWHSVEPKLTEGRAVVVDLTHVDLLDSSGLGALVSLRNRLAHEGRPVGVAYGRCRRIFEITGLSAAFVCARSVDDVLRELARLDDTDGRAHGFWVGRASARGALLAP